MIEKNAKIEVSSLGRTLCHLVALLATTAMVLAVSTAAVPKSSDEAVLYNLEEVTFAVPTPPVETVNLAQMPEVTVSQPVPVLPQVSVVIPINAPQIRPTPVSAQLPASKMPQFSVKQPSVTQTAPTAPVNPEVTARVSIGELQVLKQVMPVYPMRARSLNVEGIVRAEMLVSERGEVLEVVIREATPPGYFETAVIRALKRWRFKPLIRQGKARSCRCEISIPFKLER